MSADSKGKRIGRRIDHMGNLGEHLQDLVGFETLAHELLQNAEDARATRVVFDVRCDSLVVENDATFSDCGTVDDHRVVVCPWEASHTPSCDWHNLTVIAGRQKQDREETIGKFGVGFLSVYQLTDRPEVIAGRHWVLEEWQAEGDRIYQCPGCDSCALPDGTRFVLPFARDPDSLMRRALHAAPVTGESIADILPGIEQAVPRALVFLQHVAEIVLRENGEDRGTYRRTHIEADGVSQISIESRSGAREWLLLGGNFDREAAELRAKYGTDRIRTNRPARLRLAIPFRACSRILTFGS